MGRAALGVTLIGLMVIFCSGPTMAAPPDPKEIEAAADRGWAKVHASTTIPGAIVVVVGPDGPVLAKGYGVRDIRTGQPVDPERTLFQIGSISKLFTAILALQAVDEGKLSLDQDLRGRYPDLRFHDRYDAPVTLRQLLSHRGGFDSDISGFMTEDPEAARKFDIAYVTPHLRRIRLPGYVPAYDNVGVGMAGEIAARSFGSTYVDAVEARIMRPLGMDRSGVGLYSGREAFAAACHYTETDGSVTICPHTYMRRGFEGAGEVVVTGTDMARFMIALLHGGRTAGGGALLRPETFAAFTNPDTNRFAPGATGMGWIMMEVDIAGHKALGHAGGYDGFSSFMNFLPHSGWGVFVVMEEYRGLPRTQSLSYMLRSVSYAKTSQQKSGIVAAILVATEILKLAPPDPLSVAPQPFGPPLPPSAVAGFYTSSAGSLSRLEELFAPASGLAITADGPKAIRIAGRPFDWIGGGLYRSRQDGTTNAFKLTPAGMVSATNSYLAYVRTDLFHGQASMAALFLSLLLLLVLSVVGAVFARGEARSACRLALVLAIAALVFLGLEFQVYPTLYFAGGTGAWLIPVWRVLFDLALLVGLFSAWRAARAVIGPPVQRTRWFSVTVGALTALDVLVFVAMATVWGLWRIFD
jgi:CubicO group peptidase (beta-lactamase class C family)